MTPTHFVIDTHESSASLNNGDSLTWLDLQGELQGVQVNTVEALDGSQWRVEPNLAVRAEASGTRDLQGLRVGTAVSRNRDMAWERLLARPSADRRIAVDIALAIDTEAGSCDGLLLTLTDEEGFSGQARVAGSFEPARDAERARLAIQEQLSRLGNTHYRARAVDVVLEPLCFVPASQLNALRRDAVAALDAARAAGFAHLQRALPVEPPVPYPEDTLSYLANVYNHQAAAFYARHGVKLIEAAYESHETLGEASLMITKHCVRFSLSLCPKQTKGVTGVQGTVKAEPLTLQHGGETLTLRFDCKACEMHVVGAMRPKVLRQLREEPLTFYRTRR
jgi:23S rRNA 5-hydroxycytidine C2501 synthase